MFPSWLGTVWIPCLILCISPIHHHLIFAHLSLMPCIDFSLIWWLDPPQYKLGCCFTIFSQGGLGKTTCSCGRKSMHVFDWSLSITDCVVTKLLTETPTSRIWYILITAVNKLNCNQVYNMFWHLTSSTWWCYRHFQCGNVVTVQSRQVKWKSLL